MLDHVEGGGILEQPAREDLVPGEPFAGRRAFLDEELDKCARFRRILPRRGPLAGGQLDDRIADAARFAALQLDDLRDVVALVQETQRRDAVLDRCAELAFDHARCIGSRAGALRCLARRRGFGVLVAAA
ncbi:hypothetical protein AQZ52_01770 [Novosphingobium fuchskuhlense]|uniref:Uncharacterized protein n=1 Tax=Novosphingobium fuchskuhlense TaxID=1117702 RepID=A0A117UZH8_9SPHN|nr:hypothetical protein AQZ52_01770 [Novosphingobium fuchskuhlense]